MKKIIMDKDEIINTAKGPIRLLKGNEPEVEDWMASSLVGRGFAHYPKKEEKVVELPPDLSNLTVTALRKMAQERGIEGYNMMNKKPLLDALGPSKVTGEPGKQQFEKINLVEPGQDTGQPDESKFYKNK